MIETFYFTLAKRQIFINHVTVLANMTKYTWNEAERKTIDQRLTTNLAFRL